MTVTLPDAVSHETVAKLEAYHALLVKWQKSINLISPSTIDYAWERHFLDSLQILTLLPKKPKTLFDLGSGAGFPGLVLAIANPELSVHLIESDQRKCSFMRSVSRETNVPVNVHNIRIECFEPDIVPDMITARALASLKDLCAYVLPWAEKNPDLLLFLQKGRNYKEDLAEASKIYSFDYEAYPSETDPESVILLVSGLCKKDSF